MSDQKRQKVGTDGRRLIGYVEDIFTISDELTQCVFTQKEKPRLELRPTPLASSNQSPAASTTTTKKATSTAPSSLYSLVSASVYAAKTTAKLENWTESMKKLASKLAESGDPEPTGQYDRLLKRYQTLQATVAMYQDLIKKQTNEVLLNERVETQLEQEEKEWEATMHTKERIVAELEEELKALQDENDAEREEDDPMIDIEEDASDCETQENHELREALALRMEEKRDIEAAIQALERKKRRRSLTQQEEGQQGDENRQQSDREKHLRVELQQLLDEKDALQREIIQAEEESERQDEHTDKLPALKAEIAAKKDERIAQQTQLDKIKHTLSRLKAKMKYMVDVQMLEAQNAPPGVTPALREEAVILHLLYEHAGEIGVNELKQETSTILTAHGKASNNGAIIRALYSLVANGVVQIDRSYGNGLVTSLLV